MAFPVDLSNMLPTKVGEDGSRPFSFKGRELWVVVSKVTETLYSLAVYDVAEEPKRKGYGTDRPVVAEVLEFVWKNFLEEFPNNFAKANPKE
jgi:hypothetical protein